MAETWYGEILESNGENYLNEPLKDLSGIEGVMFSGGVGEYVYGREERDFDDMGRRLGMALRRRVDEGRLPWRLLPAGECIRATAFRSEERRVGKEEGWRGSLSHR